MWVVSSSKVGCRTTASRVGSPSLHRTAPTCKAASCGFSSKPSCEMLETPPERTLAMVVGIDHYEYGDKWRLAGPAADALRCVDWLIDRHVPTARIALFLSARS